MTLQPAVRRLALPATLLLALSLSACGGGPPTDASQEDFCELYAFEPDLDESLADAPADEQAAALKDALDETVDRAEETGTPEDIPDDARAGFEERIDAANEVSEDELRDAVENEDLDVLTGIVETENGEAYDTWAEGYCG